MDQNFSNTSSSPDHVLRAQRSLWQRLVEPVATITDVSERRQASLVSAILLVLVVAMTFGPFANLFILNNPTTAGILAGLCTGLITAYALSRTRHFRWSVPLLLADLAAYPVLSLIFGRNYTSEGLLTIFIFDILMILLSGTLASFRATGFLAAANFLGMLLVPVFFPAVPFTNMVVPLIFNVLVSVLVLVLTRHRNLIENDRLSMLDKVNSTLQTSNDALTARTNEMNARSRDLNLAIEVGRSISQVRSLEIMLKDAAEIIRSRYDLYYTQVYLINPGQTELVLQAGTGSVGAELLGREHRLPVNTGSVNGRAAIEKRAVVISDTVASTSFHSNPLLPDTRSEMAIPLLIGEKVVGVLDMQSRQAGALSQDSLPAFEALAGQLAVAIQNATLLAETEQARAEVETQARRLVRTGWNEYMDAIHKPEQTGFVFEKNQVLPLENAEQAQQMEGMSPLSASISVTGEKLGELVVEMQAEKQTTQTVELVNIVARQVAQQIESLRLLESAERYRMDAELASRRQTHEGWQAYMQSQAGKPLSYLYDLKEVRAHQEDALQPEQTAFTLPLKVRDEPIGKLSVLGLAASDDESISLANIVANRLSAHIESLRQYDQTQSALAQSETLFEASSQLTQAANLQELVEIAAKTMNIPVVNRAILDVFNYNSAGELESMDVAATWWNGTGHEPTPLGTHYSMETLRVMSLFISSTPVFFSDAFSDERFDQTAMQVAKSLNLRSGAILPLRGRTQQIGVLFMEAEETHTFTREEVRLFEALAPQISTVLENRRQYERAQHQAERESTLNIISQKIQSATTVEAVLQIAARELGHALGSPRTIAQLSVKDRK